MSLLLEKAIKLLEQFELPLKFTLTQQIEYLVNRYKGELTSYDVTNIILNDRREFAKSYDFEESLENSFELGLPVCISSDRLGDGDNSVICLYWLPHECNYVSYKYSTPIPPILEYIFMGSLNVIDGKISFIDDGTKSAKWARLHHRTNHEEETFFEYLADVLTFFSD